MLESDEIRIEPLGAANEKEWDALVQIAHNGHLMARPGFFRYHADRFEDASLFFRRGRRPLGVLPANRVGDALWSHQGVSFGGLILHPRARMEHVRAAVGALMAHMRAAGLKRLMYRAAPHPYHRFPREDDIYWLEQAGARRVETKLHSMVPCGSGAAVRAKKWSRSIRDALEHGVRLRAGTSDDLPAVWEHVELLLSKHGQSPVHSLDDISLLRSRFEQEMPLTIAEDGDGELLAGHLVLRSGPIITGFYLGETPRGRELNAGTLINNQHLNAPGNAGFWFDLGQWCDTDTREASDTLLHYKESLGGRLVRRHTWQLDLA